MSIRRQAKQIRNLRDLILLGHIAALAAILPLLVRVLKLPTLLRLLETRNPGPPAKPEEVNRIIRFTQAVVRQKFLCGQGTCLKKSLLLFHFLGRIGRPLKIHFGVNKYVILGHAWVSYDGRVFEDSEEKIQKFFETFSYEASA